MSWLISVPKSIFMMSDRLVLRLPKFANRLNFKFFIKKKIKQHYAEILEQASTRQYDYMLVISPETMDISFVRGFKASCPNATAVLYLWDSIDNKRMPSHFSTPLIKL